MRMCGHASSSEKFVAYIAAFNKADIAYSGRSYAIRKMTPVIDKTYKFSETSQRRSSISNKAMLEEKS